VLSAGQGSLNSSLCLFVTMHRVVKWNCLFVLQRAITVLEA
jgi:hypothetical protein